jgi:hypothetical protein
MKHKGLMSEMELTKRKEKVKLYTEKGLEQKVCVAE